MSSFVCVGQEILSSVQRRPHSPPHWPFSAPDVCPVLLPSSPMSHLPNSPLGSNTPDRPSSPAFPPQVPPHLRWAVHPCTSPLSTLTSLSPSTFFQPPPSSSFSFLLSFTQIGIYSRHTSLQACPTPLPTSSFSLAASLLHLTMTPVTQKLGGISSSSLITSSFGLSFVNPSLLASSSH